MKKDKLKLDPESRPWLEAAKFLSKNKYGTKNVGLNHSSPPKISSLLSDISLTDKVETTAFIRENDVFIRNKKPHVESQKLRNIYYYVAMTIYNPIDWICWNHFRLQIHFLYEYQLKTW